MAQEKLQSQQRYKNLYDKKTIRRCLEIEDQSTDIAPNRQ